MATETFPAAATTALPAPTRRYSLVAALLSYLVPGLGQIYQGRIGKGLLFLVCLYGMFFYGMSLGQWSNVYLPPESGRAGGFKAVEKLPWLSSIINDRLAYAGQFWIGVAAWPAIWHYKHDPNFWHHNYDPRREPPPIWPEWMIWRDLQRTPPETAAQVKTVQDNVQAIENRSPELDAWINGWQGKSLNELQSTGDKRWDMGLICTVIAGVLNILVIYDAFAGPALTTGGKEETSNA